MEAPYHTAPRGSQRLHFSPPLLDSPAAPSNTERPMSTARAFYTNLMAARNAIKDLGRLQQIARMSKTADGKGLSVEVLVKL